LLLKLVPTTKSKIAKASSTPIFSSTKVVKSSAISIPSSLNIFLSFSLVSLPFIFLKLGFKKIKETSHGQAVYKKGSRYITSQPLKTTQQIDL
jgi:predicted nucleotide-binding protein (sugar kinase/HSP70/actin superfamily)